MAKTSEDYAAEGRKAAQVENAGGIAATRCLPHSKSWQAQAFWMAFDAEKARLAASPLAQEEKPAAGVPIAGTGRISSANVLEGVFSQTLQIPMLGGIDMTKWPEGAREHAIQLRLQLSNQPPARRHNRLVRSMHRLIARHSA